MYVVCELVISSCDNITNLHVILNPIKLSNVVLCLGRYGVYRYYCLKKVLKVLVNNS